MDKGLRKKTLAALFAFIMAFMMLFGSITPAFAEGNEADNIAPDGVYAVSDESGKITLKWEPEEGVYGYIVYRACPEDRIAFTAKTVAYDPEYTDTTTTPGKEYQYKVTALLLKNGKFEYSDANLPVTIESGNTEVVALGGPTPRALIAPVNSNANNGYHSMIEFTWTKVDGVDSYEVWRCPGSSDQDWDDTKVKVIEVAKGADDEEWISYYDTDVTLGDNFLYKAVSVYGTQKIAQKDPNHGEAVQRGPVPPAPFPVKAWLETPPLTIKVEWGAVSVADRYMIFRSVGDDSNMTFLRYADRNETFILDNDTDYDTTYYYKVYAMQNNVPSVASEVVNAKTDPKGATTPLKAPTLITPTVAANGNDLVLTWTNNDTRATGYYIYRMEDEHEVPSSTPYKTINDASILTMTDDNVQKDKTYYYIAKAFNATMESDFSNKVNGKIDTSGWKIDLTATLVTDTESKLDWTALPSADSYEIFVSENGGAFSSLGTVSGTTLTKNHSPLSADTKYTYYVVGKSGSTEIKSNEASVTTPEGELGVPVLTGVLVPNGINYDGKLTWTAVTGADKYELFVSRNGQPYTSLGETTALEMTDPTLTPGSIYNYKVVAKKGTKVSNDSNIVELRVPLAKIINLKATAMSSSAIKLNWSAVTGAAHYDIYRSLSPSPTTGFTYVKSVSHPTVEDLDQGLQARTTYYYFVIARSAYGVESIESNIANATTLDDMCMSITPYTYCCNKKFGMLVQWKPAPGATSYTVYRSTYDGGYKQVAVTRNLSYDDKCVYPNTTYWYKVVANTGAQCVGSATSLGCSFNFKICCDHHYGREIGFTLRWKKQSGISHYTLYRSNDNVNWEYITQVAGSTEKYVDKPVSPKTVYYYRIVGSNGQVEVACDRSCGQSLSVDVATKGRKDSSLTVTWKQISNAKSYTIYRSDNGGKTYFELRTVNYLTTSFVDTGLRAGYRYYYKVVSDNGVTDCDSDKPKN